jgi:hypothetical protein
MASHYFSERIVIAATRSQEQCTVRFDRSGRADAQIARMECEQKA